MAKFAFCFLIISFLFGDILITEESLSVSENSKDLENIKITSSILNNYDKNVRPNSRGLPVIVAVKISVLKIVSINEMDLDWTCSLRIEQNWNDSRLQFNQDVGVPSIIYANQDPEIFWTPDLHFPFEKRADLGDYSTRNTYLKLYPDGQLEMNKKVTIKSECEINFVYYPLGFFFCTMRLRSFSYLPKDLKLKWAIGANDSVSVYTGGSYHHFIFVGILIMNESSTDTEYGSELQFKLYFRRHVGHYLLQWFLPSGALVLLSFLSFWMDRSAASERIGLGMTSILTITFLWSSVANSLPKTTYYKAVDFYFGFCFFICCCSVVVNAAIGFMELWRKNTEYQNHSRLGRWLNRFIIRHNLPAVLDRFAWILFPLMVCGFAVMYNIFLVPDIKWEIEVLQKQQNFQLYK